MNESQIILEIKNLSFRYPDMEKYALGGISVSINRGEKIALLGNNGAGKSTFFLCCNGVLHPECGEICLKGEKIVRGRKELMALRKAVGLVFQDPDNQIIAPTVEAEVGFGPMNLRMDKRTVKETTESAMDKMNISEFRLRPPHYLSGGEKKRVGIAGILAMQPEILLMDEPTAGLDCAHIGMFESVLEQLYRTGMSIVISTHDVDFAWRFASRVLVLSQGKIIADATAEEIFANDGLLRAAGLRKPLLFEIGEHLGMNPVPKTMEEFKCQTKRF